MPGLNDPDWRPGRERWPCWRDGRVVRQGAFAGGPGGEGMTTDTPEIEPRYERYRLAYPSGTVVMSFYAGGATLEEVRVTTPRRWSRRLRVP